MQWLATETECRLSFVTPTHHHVFLRLQNHKKIDERQIKQSYSYKIDFETYYSSCQRLLSKLRYNNVDTIDKRHVRQTETMKNSNTCENRLNWNFPAIIDTSLHWSLTLNNNWCSFFIYHSWHPLTTYSVPCWQTSSSYNYSITEKSMRDRLNNVMYSYNLQDRFYYLSCQRLLL